MHPRSTLLSCLILTACGGAAGPDEPAAPAASPEDPDERAAPPAPVPARTPLECEQEEEFGPYRVSAEEYEERHGSSAARFSELRTTKTRPLEACGPERSIQFLSRLTCDDGSSPFGGDRARTEAARRGNVGSGGRCGGIIDLYEVPCPETTYKVYVDMYICGPGMKWP